MTTLSWLYYILILDLLLVEEVGHSGGQGEHDHEDKEGHDDHLQPAINGEKQRCGITILVLLTRIRIRVQRLFLSVLLESKMFTCP